MRVTTIWFGIALAFSLQSGQANAQVSGFVRDSVAGRRVPGAVITLLDSSRKVVARSLADDSGRFRVDMPAAWVRVVKIGYRPKELRVSSPVTLRIALDRLPNMLEPMLTSDQPKCPRNATRPAAFGLWEQAKAALLGTVVARETNLATVRRISFRRYMTPRGDAIARQSVERETSQGIRSFESVLKAAEFGTRGFAQTLSANQVEFYGPDAEVLLDDALPDYYCFELAESQATRPNQAGLRFRPMKRADGRVDIDGTLWIDTVSRVLTDIEYLYLGLERWATPFHPGGTISFEETSPTSVWIDRWWIRMTGARIASPGSLSLRGGGQRVQIIEGGGELASARWQTAANGMATLGPST